jgi:hypothetical protein
MIHLQIADLVSKKPNKFTYKQLSERFNIPQNRVRGIITRAELSHLIIKGVGGNRSLTKEYEMVKKTSKQLTAEARLESQLRAKSNQHKEVDKKYKTLQDELVRAEQARDNALQIMAYRPNIFKLDVPLNTKQGTGTAVAMLSDVHCEELVPKHKVNYLNEHTPDISKRRVSKFFELLVRFIRVDRGETTINNLVLWLGGDFFTSDGHGAPTAFPPMVACMFAQDMIVSGIEFILKNEPKLNIHIVGSVGNHSRKDMAKPVNVALEQELSLEWMMYHSIRGHFANEKRITWQLDNSYHSYVKVYDKTIRFNHGHLYWRYNDGLGGIHGPVWKAISQKWNNQVHADVTCFGHYHTYTPASRARQYIANGSTIGVAPYGLGFGFEEPSQAYFLVHDKYGIVGQRPLFVNS